MSKVTEELKMIPVPREEQETIANYEYETDTWNIYTCVQKHITKLFKIFDESDCSKIWRNEDGRILAIEIEGASHEQVSFRNKSKKKELTEEERKAIAERLQRNRS